ncbi:GNAT family N-acetyltransferase [Chelativorans sp. ZYF759]|uniref:GNAT family N-acetyltransferase n=1 Tax=Chelativorans sp. ZYF759 TaxID=2692213 RepID=UPI0034D647BA
MLEGDRVRLRAHRAEDLDDYALLWSDGGVVRHIGGKPLGRSECWARILRFRGMWAMLDFGFWIVEERDSGRLIGEAGIMDLRRDILPPLGGTLEAGWALLPEFHGQGMAGEAMRLVLEWSDRHHPSQELSCIIAEGNRSSLRLAEKLGFGRSGSGDFQGSMLIHFRRPAMDDPIMSPGSA